MQFVKRKHQTIQPILPLVKPKVERETIDKTKIVSFDLLVRAGAAGTSSKYKKFMLTFEEGTPSEWLDVLVGVREIWLQNSVTGPSDRVATVRAILKGDSRTAFDAALDDARVNPDNNAAQVALSNDHIEVALKAVTTIVFPFRALEVQKLWMQRIMRKPADLSTRLTAAAITKINNSLPLFPLGMPESKFTEPEVVGLLEWSLPKSWQAAFNLKGYVPALDTKERLIKECEALERNEVGENNNNKAKSDDKKNGKKNKFAKSENRGGKSGDRNNAFFCKECGRNASHSTVDCFKLKNRAKSGDSSVGDGKAHAKPFSKRTFRKEANAIARKAAKAKALDVYAAAIKRQQGKAKKNNGKKSSAKRAADNSDSEDSESVESINNMESPIPRKKEAKKKSIFACLEDSHSSEEIDRMETNYDALEGIDRPKKKVTFKPARRQYTAEAKLAIEESAFRIACHETANKEREAKAAKAIEVDSSSSEEEFE